MTVIPVIDLLHGQVVRAVRGDRQHYRPIDSPLCRSHDPATVARMLCAHVSARALYIADLDALTGGVPQAALIASLREALPGIELWIDAGFARRADAEALRRALKDGSGPDEARRIVPVFGSESLRSAADLADCLQPGDAGAILSLDRRDGRVLDDAGCWTSPARWPQRVIAMTLEQVGADAGPDLATLAALRALSPQTRFIGAGGIRHPADLQSAAAAGAEAWLVASALHDGRLPPARAPQGVA